MIEIKPNEEDKAEEKPRREIATELHEINKTLKEILKEMKKRKI